MKYNFHTIALTIALAFQGSLLADNQTSTVSPIYPQDGLPFSISIEQADFNLTSGLHSGAFAVYKDKWLFIAGRTNGMHDFGPDNENFPVARQNTTVFVVDPENEIIYFRSLSDPSSGLTQKQIDELSVTSPQFFQSGRTLYMSGGYGFDTLENTFTTKAVLTAIDVPKLMKWVVKNNPEKAAAKYFRQTTHPLLQVTGGYMDAVNGCLSTLLVFGQNFTGYYHDDTNGDYTKQVRRFKIVDEGKKLSIKPRTCEAANEAYRRRDLNVVPVILDDKPAYVALSGVFTPDAGIWTVPVMITKKGETSMANPLLEETFKQGMNNYVCPTVGLYSKDSKEMYILICGGISYQYFDANNELQSDPEFPFINQVTTVEINKHGQFKQYIMNNQYPEIEVSAGPHAGNPYLFGAGAYFIPADDLPDRENGVFKLDKIKNSTVLGYIVGGIMSKVANTADRTDSLASPYIFKVILHKP